MHLDENNNEVTLTGRPVLGLGGQILIPLFRVEGEEEPFDLRIRNNMFTLLHGSACLTTDGYYGPHLRCSGACPFTNEPCFREFSQHLLVCRRASCTYPKCQVSRDLLAHFLVCEAADCRRCQPPVFTLINEMVEELFIHGRFQEVANVHAGMNFLGMKRAIIQVISTKWT